MYAVVHACCCTPNGKLRISVPTFVLQCDSSAGYGLRRDCGIYQLTTNTRFMPAAATSGNSCNQRHRNSPLSVCFEIVLD